MSPPLPFLHISVTAEDTIGDLRMQRGTISGPGKLHLRALVDHVLEAAGRSRADLLDVLTQYPGEAAYRSIRLRGPHELPKHFQIYLVFAYVGENEMDGIEACFDLEDEEEDG